MKKIQSKYIAFSGNIGAGKTTLSYNISAITNLRVEESDMQNPFLEKFYEDMNRWSLELQLWFLANRHRLFFENQDELFLMDRTYEEEAMIFTVNMNKMGLMSKDQLDLYFDIYKIISDQLPKPSCIIYINSSVDKLLENIAKRGREYEMEITADYLSRLNELYSAWIKQVKSFTNTPVIEINGDKVDLTSMDNAKRILKEIHDVTRVFS